jgi:hypothetical protein
VPPPPPTILVSEKIRHVHELYMPYSFQYSIINNNIVEERTVVAKPILIPRNVDNNTFKLLDLFNHSERSGYNVYHQV